MIEVSEDEILHICAEAEARVLRSQAFPYPTVRPNRVANPYKDDPVRAVIWSRAFRGCYAHQNAQ